MEEQVDRAVKRSWLNLPARYVFAGVRVLVMMLSSLQGGCMSLAITSMVKSSSPSSTTTNSTTNNTSNASAVLSDVCPVSADDGTATEVANKGGEFDWDELTQSYVTNGGTYGALCIMMIGAYLAQRMSPKMMITIISIISTVSTLLTPVLAKWSVYALIVARVLQGSVQGAGTPASGQLESSWFPPEERQQLSGLIMSSSHVGIIVSSSLTGVLIEEYGWEFVFYLYGGISLIPLLLWLFLVYDNPEEHPRVSDEEREYIASKINKETKVKLPVPWYQIAISPAVWAYVTISVSITWLAFVFMTELPTYLKRMLHFSTSQAGYITSAANAMTVISQILSGYVSHWLRSRGYISHLNSYRLFNAVATLGPTVTLIAITQVGCNAPAIVALLLVTMVLHGTFISGSFLNHMDLAINFVPTLVGLNGLVISTVGIIAPTFAAALINDNQTLSAWSKVFYIAAAVSAVPYVIFFFYGSVDEQPWNKRQLDDSEEKSEVTKTSGPRADKEKNASRDCKLNVS